MTSRCKNWVVFVTAVACLLFVSGCATTSSSYKPGDVSKDANSFYYSHSPVMWWYY